MIRSFSIFYIFCFFIGFSAEAHYYIPLNTDQKQYAIESRFVEQLEDSSASYTIEHVTSDAFKNQFKASGETMLRNNNRNAAYWFKFNIINTSAKNQQWLIESFNFRLNEITFYVKTDSGFTKVEQGDMLPFQNRSIGHKNFECILPNSSDTIQCFIRIKTKQPASFELFVRRIDTFTSYAIGEYFLLGIFYGTIGIVALFSLFMLFAFRRPIFLYYSLFLTGFGIFFMCQDGTGFQYLWPNFPLLNSHSIEISRLIMLIPYTLYFCAFLDIRTKMPVVWKFMITWIFLRIGIALIIDKSDFFLELLMYFDYIPFIVAYFSAIYAYIKGYKPALFFAIGFSVLLSAFIINSLRVACIVESNIFTAYSLNFGAVIEILFLSLALSSWLRQLIQEKALTEKLNKMLEERVQERTTVLQIQNSIINDKIDELDTIFYRLSHDIKGPLKSIIGLANLGIIDPSDRENYFKMIQSSAINLDNITSDFVLLSKVQKYNMLDLSEINFEATIHKALDQLKDSPDLNAISINTDIHQSTIFYSHQEIIDLVFLNIIDNAIKYRKWNAADSRLAITIEADKEKAILTFADNGVGVIANNDHSIFDMFYREGRKDGITGTGLGLYIVKVSLQKINGAIKFQTNADEGATFVIEIPNMMH
ncbi:sensor histidine kinase [Cytophaga aurantiaca]|uniref:sensor histidine kinase n=1 Tax=Cytophaga aurantiaca TaxID=29530 RepID=UPI00036C7AE5|nr:sensor histidine kinase [Cytophaga aurantiaca]